MPPLKRGGFYSLREVYKIAAISQGMAKNQEYALVFPVFNRLDMCNSFRDNSNSARYKMP